jgi:hypothetical protein
MPCVNKVLQLVVNFMTHITDFNKVAFIDFVKSVYNAKTCLLRFVLCNNNVQYN